MRMPIVATLVIVALFTACSDESECGDGKCDNSENIATCAEDCSNQPACENGQVTSTCACGNSTVSSGYCCNGSVQAIACSSGSAVCGNGQVTSTCTCGTVKISSGYCCNGVTQTSACAAGPGACANGKVTESCTCGTATVSSGYCCNGKAQTSACTGGPAACVNGKVTSSCMCGTTTVSTGYCCNGVAQTSACTTVGPAACANGKVAASCTCGTATVSTGYCCNGVAQTSACTTVGPAACGNGQVTSSCTCGSATVSSGYCCYGAAQTSACSSLPTAGNPDGHCSQTLPPEAQPAATTNPTTVVGTGSADSCTYDKLAAAVAKGGVITFNCGTDSVNIRVTATLELKTDRDTVIDGGNKVTLDGGSSVRILKWQSDNWRTNDKSLTLQHIVIANGKATGTEAIPTRPEPCSQGFNDGEGGGLFMRDGVFRAIDVTFTNNQAALLGPDTGGGALYLLGVKAAYIASCSFLNNRASNGGGMGSLFATNYIYDSLFDSNQATGHGANMDDASKCSYINNDQNEVGSGGNGGAIYNDGADKTSITICGTQVRNNHANAFGAALFFTSNDPQNLGSLTIQDSHFFENKQCLDWWEVQPGISMTEAVYKSNNMINSVFTKPSNWSSEDDPVCADFIAAFSG